MNISKRVSQMPPSGIREFFELVLGTPDVISLGVGEPDFDTPWTIRESSIYAIEKGQTSYTSNKGLIELRKNISKDLKKRYQLDYDSENEILITVGVSQGMDLALRSILDPGDHVIIPEPCYVSYHPLTYLVGAVPIYLSTRETNFKVTPQTLEQTMHKKPKALILNYPSNPTGVSYTKKELENLASVLKGTDTLIISDEIYDKLTYPYDHTAFPTLAHMKEKTIYLNGFSKAYAMTGWRIAYAAAPADIIEGMTKIHQYAMLCAPIQSQFAAIEALLKGEKSLKEMKTAYEQRNRFIQNALSELGLSYIVPDGAFYIFTCIESTHMSSIEFAKTLLREENVAVVPGSAFGPGGEGYVRISFANDIKTLKEAVNRISKFLKKHSK